MRVRCEKGALEKVSLRVFALAALCAACISPGARVHAAETREGGGAFTLERFVETVSAPLELLFRPTGPAAGNVRKGPVPGRILFASNKDATQAVYLCEGGRVTMICMNGADPSWSPDGTFFVCRPTASSVSWDLALVDTSGRLIRLLKPFGNGSATQARFAGRDPSAIYFRARRDLYTPGALYRLDLATEKVTAVSFMAMSSFDVSPDGSSIVCAAPMDEAAPTSRDCLWIMDASGAHARPLGNTSGASCPAFSPDGARVAYARPDDAGFVTQIHVIDLKGLRQQRVTSSPYPKNRPSWSPDGKILCCEAQVDTDGPAATVIFAVNADGTDEGMLGCSSAPSTGGPARASCPSFSPR